VRSRLSDPVAIVATLLALDALAVLVTYSRVPPEELYNVSRSGIGGGLSRLLVLLCFPDALIAIGALAAVWHLLPPRVGRLAWIAVILCAVVAVPGVVDQDDLDARVVNVLPAAGTTLGFVLALRFSRPVSLGWGYAVIAAVLAALSVPWIFADLGFHVGLGIFRAGEPWHGEASVHLGYHHGLSGVLIVLSALLLLRLARRPVARGWLLLLLVYGAVNAAQDFWLEQVVKRGWTSREIPGALEPRASWIWLVMVVAGAVLIAADRAVTPGSPAPAR
jgi:hypothetical protein